MSRASDEHHAHAPRHLRFGILTVSDSRTPATDDSGALCERLATHAGHTVTRRALVKDDAPSIRAAVDAMLDAPEVDVVVTNGGTGLARRDVTIEALAPIIERPLPGFGELFRTLSFEQVGSAAMLSRAEAGVARGKPVFALPGSPDACQLAMARLVLPEAGHLVGLLRR